MRMLGPIGSGVGTSYWRSGPMTSGERRQLLEHPVDLGRSVVVAEPQRAGERNPAFGQALGGLGRMLVADADRERGGALAGALGFGDPVEPEGRDRADPLEESP